MFLAGVVGCLRQSTAMRDGRQDFFAADGGGGGKWGQHIIGCQGEMAVAKHFNIFWSGTVGQVHLPDVGDLEVRTRQPGEFGADLTLRNGDKADRRYLLVVATPPFFDIKGWMYGRDGMIETYRHPRLVNGEALFYVPPHRLQPMTALEAQDAP